MGAAGVVTVVFCLGVGLDAFLDGVPGGEVDDGVAVVFDDEVAELEDADVELVGEEGFVGADACVEFGLFVDVGEGGTFGFELEGKLKAWHEVWVGDPAMGGVGGAVSSYPNLYRLSFEAAGGCAWDASVFEDEFAEAALGVGGGLAAFFFVGDVYEEFDDASVLAFGDGVGEGVNEDVAVAEEGFVVDGVVEVTGEAGVVPEEEGLGAVLGVSVVVEHGVEGVAACGGAAAFGFVGVGGAECEVVLCAVGLDFGELLLG